MHSTFPKGKYEGKMTLFLFVNFAKLGELAHFSDVIYEPLLDNDD